MTAPQLRKDAARNWERIVAVARQLVDQGATLQLNDVARRAGLGVATVYRHFATPEAAHGEQALADTDPWRALTGFLSRIVEAQLTDAALPPVAAAAEDALPRTTRLKRSLETAGTALLDRAREAGAVRPDLAAADMVPLMCGIAHAAHVRGGAPGDRIDAGHRYLATLLEGMRTAPPRT
jgi:AcrR family transcriptional regulator